MGAFLCPEIMGNRLSSDKSYDNEIEENTMADRPYVPTVQKNKRDVI